VIRKGVLQQVESPQHLYDHPDNLFVAGFIGSPAMNMVEADLTRSNGSLAVGFSGFTLAIPDEVLSSRPALKAYEGKPVVVGIRPEDMEDASLVSDAPADRRIRSGVILREALGADVLVHFGVRARPVITEDTKELAHDVGAEVLEAVEKAGEEGEWIFLARLNPRTKAQQGKEIELVVDTSRFHFFDPETGRGIYDGEPAPTGNRTTA
jgi:multiple sugar transport system ATP-binding protein